MLLNSWRSYNYSSIEINRSWHITYKDKNGIAVVSLNRRSINSQGKSKKESKRVDLIINIWMAQYIRPRYFSGITSWGHPKGLLFFSVNLSNL